MAPLTPHWPQPSHPLIQKVLINKEKDFATKSISLVDVPPFGIFAKMEFPPCTKAEKPTYATVQMSEGGHLNLNSDLVYINHSCEPSVLFDTSALLVTAGPAGLKAGDELTFFYPSTEWDMAQGFDCNCGTKSCRGWVSGAKNMAPNQLSGFWLNAHIHSLLSKQEAEKNGITNGTTTVPTPAQKQAHGAGTNNHPNGTTTTTLNTENGNAKTRGITSRELSGEMGGDTSN